MKTFSKIALVSALQSSHGFVNVPQTFQSKHLMSLNPSEQDQMIDSYTAPDTPSGPSYADNLEARLSDLDSQRTEPGPRPSLAKQIFRQNSGVKVQGGTLKTWTFNSPSVEAVHVVMKTSGRPLDADVELWQGPDNTPVKMRVYVEDGSKRPFSAMIATPRGPNTISLRNIGHMEFPLDAIAVADTPDLAAATDTDALRNEPLIIQGGALRTFPFDSFVQSIQILLNTDGRPLNARIELLQGPNNVKQVVELYTEDGMERPFYMVMESPGTGNVVRIVNTATVEFPLTARVEEYSVDSGYDPLEPIMGGDTDPGFMGGGFGRGGGFGGGYGSGGGGGESSFMRNGSW